MGSPGSYNWKGNLFMVNVSNEFLLRDKTCYYSPVRDVEKSPVESYSYLGNFILVLCVLLIYFSLT